MMINHWICGAFNLRHAGHGLSGFMCIKDLRKRVGSTWCRTCIHTVSFRLNLSKWIWSARQTMARAQIFQFAFRLYFQQTDLQTYRYINILYTDHTAKSIFVCLNSGVLRIELCVNIYRYYYTSTVALLIDTSLFLSPLNRLGDVAQTSCLAKCC